MRMLFLGGAYPSLVRRLRELGIEDVYLASSPDPDLPPALRWWGIVRAARSPGEALASLRHAVDEVNLGPGDAVLVFKGWFGPRERVDPSVVRGLRRRGVRTLYVSFDDPFFEEQIGASRTHAPSDAYDAYLSCDATTVYRLAGRYRVSELLWPAWDPILWDPGDAVADSGPDVAVVGSPYSGARWGTLDRPDFVRRAVERGIDVAVWGPRSWLDAGIPSSAYRCHLPIPENGRVAVEARICLSSHVRRSRRYLNARTFQVMGAGGVLLTDRQEGWVEMPFLRDGETVVAYRDPEEALDLAEAWSSDALAEDRRRVREAAREAVAVPHSYARRAEILRWILDRLG